MDIKSAKKVVNEIIDLCSQIQDQTLNETTEGIYNDLQAAKSLETVISSARELMVFVLEVQGDDIYEIVCEIENIFNDFLEDCGEF